MKLYKEIRTLLRSRLARPLLAMTILINWLDNINKLEALV
jgi:hypothetical protein